jgi:hypothetical protein
MNYNDWLLWPFTLSWTPSVTFPQECETNVFLLTDCIWGTREALHSIYFEVHEVLGTKGGIAKSVNWQWKISKSRLSSAYSIKLKKEQSLRFSIKCTSRMCRSCTYVSPSTEMSAKFEHANISEPLIYVYMILAYCIFRMFQEGCFRVSCVEVAIFVGCSIWCMYVLW